jgi:hypothetical protein
MAIHIEPSAQTTWSNVSAGPVTANGQYTVTKLIDGPQPFFRLADP